MCDVIADINECLVEDNVTMVDNMCNNGDASMPGYMASVCYNTLGSHRCVCPMAGYQLDPATYLCKGTLTSQ